MGVVFLFYGVEKFTHGNDAVAHGMAKQFAGKLPEILVLPFGYTLPFFEVAVGTLLIVGLFTETALAVAGLMLVALTFGQVLLPDPATVAFNVSFSLVIFVLLWTADENGYSIDRMHRGPRRP